MPVEIIAQKEISEVEEVDKDANKKPSGKDLAKELFSNVKASNNRSSHGT